MGLPSLLFTECAKAFADILGVVVAVPWILWKKLSEMETFLIQGTTGTCVI